MHGARLSASLSVSRASGAPAQADKRARARIDCRSSSVRLRRQGGSASSAWLQAQMRRRAVCGQRQALKGYGALSLRHAPPSPPGSQPSRVAFQDQVVARPAAPDAASAPPELGHCLRDLRGLSSRARGLLRGWLAERSARRADKVGSPVVGAGGGGHGAGRPGHAPSSDSPPPVPPPRLSSSGPVASATRVPQ